MPKQTTIYDGERVSAEQVTFGDWKPGVFYTVNFGDGGWERDPGIEAESLAVAITEVKTGIRELQELLGVLEALEA